jgi:hypothetical protein
MMNDIGLRAPFRRTLLCIWAGFLVLATVFAVIHARFAQDDAYITYRYARNLASGSGFVYNEGESVLGTTTPLYTLLLAAGTYITGSDVATVSLIVCLISLWIGAGALYQLGESQSKGFALAASLIFLTDPFLRHFVGMESYFLMCMFLLTIWAYVRNHLVWTSALGGLLVLVRYEMLILIIMICIHDYMKRKRPPLWMLPGLLPPLVWAAYAVATFGSPIPLSASAKLAASRVPFPVGMAVY